MQNFVICSVVCIVILSNCLVSDARSLLLMDPRLLSKRNLERRSFLKSFCARRCNIGKGGNVCRCNGFHFAGKRTSKSPLGPEQLYSDALDESLQEQMLYKLLEETGKIRLQPDRNRAPRLPEQTILEEIQELLPEVLMEEETR